MERNITINTCIPWLERHRKRVVAREKVTRMYRNRTAKANVWLAGWLAGKQNKTEEWQAKKKREHNLFLGLQ